MHLCKAYGIPIGADDAKEVMLIKVEDLDLEKLVFDHSDILRDYLKRR